MFIIRSGQKWSGCAWVDGYDNQIKDKNITIAKNKSLLFFLCSVS